MNLDVVLLGIGMCCFGGLLVAEGTRRSAWPPAGGRDLPGPQRPMHQESGYTYRGVRAAFEQLEASWPAG